MVTAYFSPTQLCSYIVVCRSFQSLVLCKFLVRSIYILCFVKIRKKVFIWLSLTAVISPFLLRSPGTI